MLDLELPQRIAAKGVPAEEYPGWRTRSAGSYTPRGHLTHHTAGGPNGRAPSLGTVANGRPGLPGPLAQTLQTREADGWDHAIVVAAGRANHAGLGGWNGLTGNAQVSGNEVEHTGYGRVNPDRLEVAARIAAANLEAPGSTWNADFSCQHFEWAPTRKVDFRELYPFTTSTFRARVGYWIGRTISTPTPPITVASTEEDEPMHQLVRAYQWPEFYDWTDGGLVHVENEKALARWFYNMQDSRARINAIRVGIDKMAPISYYYIAGVDAAGLPVPFVMDHYTLKNVPGYLRKDEDVPL